MNEVESMDYLEEEMSKYYKSKASASGGGEGKIERDRLKNKKGATKSNRAKKELSEAERQVRSFRFLTMHDRLI